VDSFNPSLEIADFLSFREEEGNLRRRFVANVKGKRSGIDLFIID
jgi:hypothetical protein